MTPTARCPHCAKLNHDLDRGTNTCLRCGKDFQFIGRPLLERDIEKRLVQRAKELGGEVRKVKWIGRSGAPDRLVMLPPKDQFVPFAPDVTIWVELKAPGKKPEPHQMREHARMRKMGQRVVVIDSYEQIEELLK